MNASTLTTKGQITIPIQIRSYLGIHPGDKIEFIIDKEGRVVVTPLTSDITQLKGYLPKPKRKIYIEKMNEIIRKHEFN